MTEENQKRRAFLVEIESIVRETLEAQPADDDPVRCGMALDQGIARIAGVVRNYLADWPETAGLATQCTGCGKAVPPEQAHYVPRPRGAAPQGVGGLLCDTCYAAHRAGLDKPSGIPSWTMSGRHG